MTREAWTDERIDDLKRYLQTDIRELKEEQRELRAALNTLRRELVENRRSRR